MADRITRYYSITDLIDDPNDRMGDYRLDVLFKFLSQNGIEIYQGDSEKEKLAKNGIHIINNSYIAYTFIYPSNITQDSDEFLILEKEIIDFAQKNTNLIVEEIKARLDYEFITEKLYHNLLYLTEDVLVPNNATDFEAYIITYVSNIYTSNNTLVITDPYLFPKNSDLDYEKEIKNILLNSHAKEIIAYVPINKLNTSLFNSVVTYLSANNIKLRHIDKDNFHDRFWICKENRKGFVMGTSLNGIGRKISWVDLLYEYEVDVVLSELS